MPSSDRAGDSFKQDKLPRIPGLTKLFSTYLMHLFLSQEQSQKEKVLRKFINAECMRRTIYMETCDFEKQTYRLGLDTQV